MTFPIYHIDAFTDQPFSGNPASVVLLEKWLADKDLHAIAKENNLPATTFLVAIKEGYQIRWITPEYELNLCGHGTLAAAYVIFNHLSPTIDHVRLVSSTESLGVMKEKEWFTLNFPMKAVEDIGRLPLLENALGLKPKEIYAHHDERCFAVFDNEDQIKSIQVDISLLKELNYQGITITAPGNEADFVSRTFYPKKTMFEDAATGASHCLLTPFWSKRLKKTTLYAKQVSARGGEMRCRWDGARVFISGKACLYMQGMLKKPQ